LHLGFARLAIQDLSRAGNQPMHSEDGLYTLLFNGEIYNFPQLKEALMKLKYSFKSNSDSEVILAGYQSWGLNGLLEKLDGMFAIVLVDRKSKQIHLIRDHFGIKPLFYYLDESVFYFASEIKPILRMLPTYEINLENLEKSIYFTSLPRNDGSNIKNINRVLPGACITLDLRTMHKKELIYFQFKYFANLKILFRMHGFSILFLPIILQLIFIMLNDYCKENKCTEHPNH
jgi:asparagine synthase (glutamine-hydrolysing)